MHLESYVVERQVERCGHLFPVNGTAIVISFAPILTLVLAVGALLAFSDRFRRLGTVMASSSLLLLGAAFVI